jgi:hypothetical protein
MRAGMFEPIIHIAFYRRKKAKNFMPADSDEFWYKLSCQPAFMRFGGK